MKNIDKAIHMTVAAKLREKGVAADAADKTATANAAAARKVYDDHVKTSAKMTESVVDGGLGAVSQWAAALQ